MRGAIRVIFNTLDLGRYTVLGALEVNNAIVLLVSTTNMPGCYPTIVVATTVPGLRFQQGLVRRPLMQSLSGHPDNVATTG
jgi:hypothetical protein